MSCCKKSVFHISDLTFVPTLEYLIFPVEMVVILLIELPAHPVFFQNSDNELRKSLLFSFGFKELQHLSTDAHSHIIRI